MPLEHRRWPLLEESRPGQILGEEEGGGCLGSWREPGSRKLGGRKRRQTVLTSIVSASSPLGKEVESKYNK